MARPKCARLIHEFPDCAFFKPRGIPLSALDAVTLTFDECEALRLADFEGLYHNGAATRMHISRATFGRIIEAARRKVADALIHGKAIRIQGGTVRMPEHRIFECTDCEQRWEVPFGTGRPKVCPQCKGINLQRADPQRGPLGARGRAARGTGGGAGRGAGCRRPRGTTSASTKETF